MPSNQFLCHPNDFAQWAGDRTPLGLEDFYRWQRRCLGYLMDDGEPAGGDWNYDRENREPPLRDGGDWPEPMVSRLDDVDFEVINSFPDDAPGADPVGWWATFRRGALARLRRFIDDELPRFGPHEDAMVWHLAHSLPNVMGMGPRADGGRISTKPCVSGGAYINRMSDYCAGRQFDPAKRTGADACPFTTLYWAFLDRHRDQLQPNARMARQYHTLDRLTDLPQLRVRAE